MMNKYDGDGLQGRARSDYEPSAEGKQGGGEWHRERVGDTTCRGQRHVNRAKREHYPLKDPGCLVATSPDAMEVQERPSRTLRNL